MRYGYRHTTGVLAVIIIFLLGCAAVLAQTVDSTGNLVNPTTTTSGSTWTNGVYQNSLTCWQAGDPGYCGPNAIVRPGGDINFSYGTTDLYQQVNIAQSLPYSGTGLLVRGYSFSYVAKVGNGWDDGRWDFLQSYVQLRGPSGDLKSVQVYTHNTTHDWSSFNLSRSFPDNRFTTQDLATARFGFVGRDNNYFAGPYGPEVNSVSFSLQYMRDPCLTNQLSSPQCPKFMETLNQMSAIPGLAVTPATPAPMVVDIGEQSGVVASGLTSAPSNSSQSANSSVAATPTAQSFALNLIKNNQQRESRLANSSSVSAMAEAGAAAESAQREAEIRIEAAQTAAAQAAAETAQTQNSAASISTTTMTMPAFTVSLPQVTTPTVIPPANNESNTQQSAESLVSPQTSTASNTSTSVNVEQLQPATAVTTAVRMVTPTSVGSQDVQESVAVSSSITTAPTTELPVVESAAVNLGPAPTSVAATQPTISTAAVMYTPPVSTEIAVVNIIPAVEIVVPVVQVAGPLSTPVDTAVVDNSTTSPTNFTTNRTNPITEIVEQRQVALLASTPTFRGPVVNTNVADNDLAGSVRIDSLAKVPSGFDLYTSLALRDVAFYAPREIYRGQRNIDNVRALRNLAQEARHQEMVDQQYRR